MPGIINTNRSNSGKKNVTSITRSQRSSCNVVVYRWNDTDMTKLNALDAKGEKGYEGRGQGSVTGNFNEKSKLVIRNDVIRANVSKNKSSNSGNFSITLKKGKKVVNGRTLNEDIDYLKEIHPGDWIMIYIKKSGNINTDSINQSSGFKCLGVVKNVRYLEMEDAESGKPRLEYLVTGEDFGSVFDMSVFFNPLLNQDAAQILLGAKFLTNSSTSVKGSDLPNVKDLTPDNIIKKLVGFYLGGGRGENLDKLNSTNQTWYIPPLLGRAFNPDIRNKGIGTSFVDILKTDKIGLHRYNRDGRFQGADRLPGATFIKALPSSGSVWAILGSLQNNIANEMYTELVPDARGNLRPSLVMRQLPFSNRTTHETNPFAASAANGASFKEMPLSRGKTFFVDLPRHNIVSSDIIQKNVGKSDHERINHVLVVPKIDTNNIDPAFISVINTPSIQRYGLKSFQGQTQYVIDSDLGDPKKACKYFTHLLVDWHFLSHHLYNGTINIDGTNDHIQLGNNLYIEDLGQLYHIEGYTHTYEIQTAKGSNQYTIDLTVSRGQSYVNNFAKFIGSRESVTISSNSLEGLR